MPSAKKLMPGGEKNFSKLARNAIWLLFVSCFIVNCTGYNPDMYPSYDVLNPSDEVTVNPIGLVIADQVNGVFLISWEPGLKPEITAIINYMVVSTAFLMHYRELWDEVIKLRKLIK